MSDAETQSSGSPLLQWAGPQPIWVRQIVRDVLDGVTTPDNLQTDSYVELCLSESGLNDRPTPVAPLLAEPAAVASSPTGARLRLDSIEIVGGVNRLKDGAKIEFAPGLTVIFGENGSGKSGFVRVLKRVSGARTHGRILGDVTKASNPSPSAALAFDLGGTTGTLAWNDEIGVAPLTQLSVFDTPASRVHIDDDLAYTYTPEALSFYRTIRDALETSKTRLSERVDQNAVDPERFRPIFKPGTAVYRIIERLHGRTDVNALQRLAAVTPEEEARQSELKAEVAVLRSSSPEAEMRLAQAQAAALIKIISVLQLCTSFDREAFAIALRRLEAAKVAEKKTTSSALDGLGIPAVSTPEWKAFMDAADAYDTVAAHEGHDPNVTCSYCRQNLTEAAIAIVTGYHEFTAGAARKERELLDAMVGSFVRVIGIPSFSDAEAVIDTEVGTTTEHAWSQLKNALQKCQLLQIAVKTHQVIDWSEYVAGVEQALVFAQEEKGRVDRLVMSLGAAKDDKAKRLLAADDELSELTDRLALRGQLVSVTGSISQLAWNDAVSGLVRSLSTAQRQLTEASTEHTTRLVNSNFQTTFDDECLHLEAPAGVTLEFPGREGQTKRKKTVAEGVKPSDVLSEGEQKAVAMADFLAEASVSGSVGPLVFDDPVNSMDYKRLEVVASRLQTLARTQQVVVFTHDVWFASVLLDLNGDDRKNARYWDVSRTAEGAGIVTPASHPDIDSYNNLKRRLNVVLQQATNGSGDEQRESVKKGYGLVRSLTEVVVEKDLFRGVCQRYQAHVMMTQLSNINTGALHDSIEKLYNVYERACRITDAHSQPHQQSNVPPSLEQLQKDFATVEAIHEEHKA